MITTVLWGSVTLEAGEEMDYGMTLEYYLVSEPLCEEYSDLLRYGVKIRKISEHEDGKHDEETKEIRDIFYQWNHAMEFMDLLVRNKVTPTGFKEIIEEYIENKIIKVI